ncbi:MAG: LysM peptidoglycan-binding domain-containing protein [Prevotellaceae bacterium]|nr:LysM peptidoglycan-binding domain-containing protein [Prevotellaceae bacterium]
MRSGQTLSYIAHRYGTTVSTLCKLNRINRNTVLRVGRSIRYR